MIGEHVAKVGVFQIQAVERSLRYGRVIGVVFSGIARNVAGTITGGGVFVGICVRFKGRAGLQQNYFLRVGRPRFVRFWDYRFIWFRDYRFHWFIVVVLWWGRDVRFRIFMLVVSTVFRIGFLVIRTIKVYVKIDGFKEIIFVIVKWQFEIVLSVLPWSVIFTIGRFVVIRGFVVILIIRSVIILISWFVIVLVRRSLLILVIWSVIVFIRRFIVFLVWRSVAIIRWVIDVLIRRFIIVLISLLLSLWSI